MAIQTLKHAAFRIWTAVAVSIPLTLWLLSLLNDAGGVAMPLAVMAALFSAVYAGSGWLASRAALRLIPPLMHEAGLWERGGDFDRANRTYQKILALYDSFLMSPKARHRGVPPLVARMARLYAAQADKEQDTIHFIERYLYTYPTDRDIAETWLQTREYERTLTPVQQELADRIAAALPDDSDLQATLARLFLRTKRTDFPALQTYRRAMGSRAPSSRLASDLARLFIDEGRSDEWALPVYLQAARQEPPDEALRCGLAACLRWIPPSERNAERLIEARDVLGDPEEEALVRMSSGFVPPTGRYPMRGTPEPPPADAEPPERPGHAVLSSVSDSLRRLWRQGIDTLTRSPQLRRGLTWGLMAGLAIMAAVFLINTVRHLTPSPTPEPAPSPAMPTVEPSPPPMPYTLQVAAYLKPEHAERYLQALQAQGIEAYVTQAHGSDKTWYQVRIAHFPSKAAALAYGSELKSRGLVEDFYVAIDPQR